MSGKAVRETLAALGVIASLVFVGTEIRQNTAIARGQARQELATLNQEWLMFRLTERELTDIWNTAWEPDAMPSEDEARQANLMMLLNMRRLENVYLQYAQGLVRESALDSYGLGSDSDRYRSPRFREWWSNVRSRFDPDFVSYFDGRYGIA